MNSPQGSSKHPRTRQDALLATDPCEETKQSQPTELRAQSVYFRKTAQALPQVQKNLISEINARSEAIAGGTKQQQVVGGPPNFVVQKRRRLKTPVNVAAAAQAA